MAIFIKFVFFSGLAALVNVLTGLFLYGVLGLAEGWEFAFSVAMAFLMGMMVSYFLNRRYSFRPSGRVIRYEMTDFFLVSIGGLILTTGLAQLFLSYGTPVFHQLEGVLPVTVPVETMAHMMAVLLNTVYSFTCHKHISFRAARRPQ